MLLLLVVAVSALAACGSGSSGATTTSVSVATTMETKQDAVRPTTTTTKPLDYKAQYLALAIPLNAANSKYNAFLRANPNGYDKIPDVLIVGEIGAIKTFDNAALRASWPNASTVADIHARVTADAAYMADLEVANANRGSATYHTQEGRDVEALTAAINIVRADLGLPPTK